ncbi:uncharacterized protein [Triticum aestivum]|uniref:uncharacterized protein isoform X4 n=2 Tax=Triticum aestivum TaxID=4565 RepID=UPI001D01D4E7|nr:uncharacterized protein LOC123149257 isoform X4 [Triticum aestivum]
MRRLSRRPSPGASKTVRGRRAAAWEEAAHAMDKDDLQNSDPTMDEEESSDGSFSTRFSAPRLREVADNELNDKKRALLEKSSFGSLMKISPFYVPLELIDWVVMKIDTQRSLFSHKKKTILFTRDMVHKIFNVPSGPRAVELLKRNERCELRDIYRIGTRAPMKKSISVIKEAADDDAITLERTWVLLCLALVLVPGTGNMVSMDYLASLKDLDEINEFVWDEHVLATALREARKYQQNREAGASGFWIGGCLPMFALIYMDFLEVPRSLVSEGTFKYSLHRACFVRDADFKLVTEFDRNKLALDKVEFGKRNHRSLSQTPYAILDADKNCEGQTQNHQANASNRAAKPNTQVRGDGDLGGEFCGSLDEWLQPLPSCEELEIPLQLKPIYEKHKKLYMAELKNVVTSFGKVLQSTFCKRLGYMLLEAHSNATSNQEHRREGGDLTFVVPRVNAASSEERTGAVSFGIPTATAAGVVAGSSTCTLSEPDIRVEEGADEQNKSTATVVSAALKGRECSVLGGKVGVEAEHGEGGTAGRSTSPRVQCSEGAVLQQVRSSNHCRGKDFVEQDEVAIQGGKVIPQDACNINASGADDNVETPVLSQGTLQAIAVTALEWEDGPCCALFKEGTEDYEWFNQKIERPVKPVQTSNTSSSDVPNSTSSGPTFDSTPHFERPSNPTPATIGTAPKLPRQNDIPGPVFDVSPILFKTPSSDGPQVVLHEALEVNVEARDGSDSHGKQSKKKMMALSPDIVPMMKKIKVDAHGGALHQQTFTGL